MQTEDSGRHLVARVRAAAADHGTTWEALVPDHLTINLAAEVAEEEAYAELARAKAELRDHICKVYGLSIKELSGLVIP